MQVSRLLTRSVAQLRSFAKQAQIPEPDS
jgi:hypothetical protein